jgi:hypothetical protein
MAQVKRNIKKVGLVGMHGDRPSEVFEKFTRVIKKKGPVDTAFIISALRKHFIFYNLSIREL